MRFQELLRVCHGAFEERGPSQTSSIILVLGSFLKPLRGPRPTEPPTTPEHQQRKKFQKPKNLRENRISPQVNIISPKVSVISSKVNALSPKVNVKYVLGIFEEFRVFETLRA